MKKISFHFIGHAPPKKSRKFLLSIIKKRKIEKERLKFSLQNRFLIIFLQSFVAELFAD